MRHRLLSPLLLALTITLGVAVPATAQTPLVGSMDLQFNLAWPGPSEDIPDWVGTVTIDGAEYGMAFFNTGTGKSFDSQPDGNVIFFEETWVIYQELHFVFEEVDAGFVLTEFEPGAVLLSGYDRRQQATLSAIASYCATRSGRFHRVRSPRDPGRRTNRGAAAAVG